jgi:hypothetical protein
MIAVRLQPMHRQVLLLASAQALFQTASTLVLTVGALAGNEIASTPRLATVPIASMSFWNGDHGRSRIDLDGPLRPTSRLHFGHTPGRSGRPRCGIKKSPNPDH